MRQALGLSQEALATKAGVNYNVLIKIESGATKSPRIDTLSKIASALNVSPVEILQPDERPATRGRERLPIAELPPEKFVEFIFALVDRSGNYHGAQIFDGTGDKQRDVIAYKRIEDREETWFFDCKRRRRLSFSILKTELDNLNDHILAEPDFKPDQIVFCLSLDVSARCKDDTRKHAVSLDLPEPIFWCLRELDGKAKEVPGIQRDFFGGTAEEILETHNHILKEVKSSEERLLEDGDKTRNAINQFAASPRPDLHESISKDIDFAVDLIKRHKIPQARDKLIGILGRLVPKKDNYRAELARVYNNLGICHNRPDGRQDLQQAEKYFDQALEMEPALQAAKINLVSVYIQLDKTGRAYKLASDLWDKDKGDPMVLKILIWSILAHKGPEKTATFFEAKSAMGLVKKDAGLLSLTADTYLRLPKPQIKKAEKAVDRAMKLAPDIAEHVFINAKVHYTKALKDCTLDESELMPRIALEKMGLLYDARSLFDNARVLARDQANLALERDSQLYALRCSVLLGQAHESRYAEIRASGAEFDDQNEELSKYEVSTELVRRNFEIAYKLLISSALWSKLPIEEKYRLAYVFFMHGGIEEAKRILEIEEVAKEKTSDPEYWAQLSLVDILLGDRNAAIINADRACQVARGKAEEREFIKHRNTVNLRYSGVGETDRFIKGVLEFDAQFPEARSITPIRMLDGQGHLTDEIKEVFKSARERHEAIRSAFRSMPVPTYFLEESLARPYVEVLNYGAANSDPEFIIDFSIPDNEFEQESENIFQQAETLVFDYSSLLDLSKMNVLSFLGKLDKRLLIHKELFRKIQAELLYVESDELRRLWDFLRKSRNVEIVNFELEKNFIDEKAEALFENWLTQSMLQSKATRTAMITDDMRLIRLLKGEKIHGTNVLTLVKHFKKLGLIDQKMFSQCLGKLAERLYVFISFSGEDLFHIVLEDQAKVTLRTNHLIGQIALPGSSIESFAKVFINFIGRLWNTGCLAEDKVLWLRFLSERLIAVLENNCDVDEDTEILQPVFDDLIKMWLTAIKLSDIDEMTAVEKEIDVALDKAYLTVPRQNIRFMLEEKKRLFEAQ